MLALFAVLAILTPFFLIGLGLSMNAKARAKTAALPPGERPSRGPGIVLIVIGALQLGAMAVFVAVLSAIGDLLSDLHFDFTKGRLLRIEGRARPSCRRLRLPPVAVSVFRSGTFGGRTAGASGSSANAGSVGPR